MSGYLGDPRNYDEAIRHYRMLDEFMTPQSALEAWRRYRPDGDTSVPGGNRAKRRADAARRRA